MLSPPLVYVLVGEDAISPSLVRSVREFEIAEITPTNVTQGRTWTNNEDFCAAAHAIDKDLSTHAVTHTDNGAGWLKLGFDKTYFIHKVVIYGRFYTNWFRPNGDCVKSIANFKACVDDDNNVDVSVYQGEVHQKSCGTLQLTYGLKQSDQIYTLLCNTEGDIVKLSKSTGIIVVLEIAVSNKNRKQHVAEITPTSATQGTVTDGDCCAAAHAIDKDLSTPSATLTDNGAGWLKLKLDKTYFIHKVVIYYMFPINWYDPIIHCVKNFNACVDHDNNVDVSVYQGEVKQKSCGTLQLTYGREQSDQIYTLLCNTEGDTVKLAKDAGIIAVYEIAVTRAGLSFNLEAYKFF
ncbi:hypothetical protein ACHWQZ_G005574 [Mnemiopsis leidyi]